MPFQAVGGMGVTQILFQLAESLRPDVVLDKAAYDIEQAVIADAVAGVLASVDPNSIPYPPLKHPRRSGNTGPPLIDYGNLVVGIQAQQQGEELIMKSFAPGAASHQFGSPAQHIPQRAFLGVGESTVERLADVVAKAAQKVAEGI
jgi:phage gpG-like protein